MRETTPYLTFDGDCLEAMSFYMECLGGGELYVRRYGDLAGACTAAGARLQHARLKRGFTVIMAEDLLPGTAAPRRGTNVTVHLLCDSDREVDVLYGRLSAGGTPVLPPYDTFGDDRVGILTDRYGVRWMLHYERVPPL